MTTAATKDSGATGRWGHFKSTVRGNVLMMGLVSFFTDASSEMIYPLLPVFLGWWGNPALWLGIMEGVAEATSSLLKMLSGRLSDRVGKRKALVVIGYGASTAFRPLMALALAPWHVVALRFGDRIGKGVRTSPRDGLIGESVDAGARGLAFSFHRAMDHAGAVLGALMALLILYLLRGSQIWYSETATSRSEMVSLRWVFAVALLPGLAAMAALVWKVREIAPAPAPADPAAGRFAVYRQLPRRFYWFVVAVTLFALGNSSDLFILLLAKARFDFGLGLVICVWVVLHLSKIAFSVPGGWLSDKLGRRPLILAGWGFYALIYLVFAWVHQDQQWLYWALVVAYGLFYGLTEGAEKALVADFAPRQFYGTAFGLYHAAVGLAALPASLLFGILWTSLDSVSAGLGPKVAFTTGAVLAALAATVLIALVTAARRPGPTPGGAEG